MIRKVDVRGVPFPFIGGAITIELADGKGTMEGEFLERRSTLLKALRSTPLATGRKA
jgi:hypothetical protein